MGKFRIMVMYVGLCASAYSVGAAAASVAVNAILDTVPIAHASVIEPNEWHELDGDALAKKLDRSITGFGCWGLRQLLWPVADSAVLEYRQQLIKKLVADQEFFDHYQSLLQDLARTETNILSYWQEHNELHEQVKSLYFSLLGSYSARFDAQLNNSRTALECACVLDIINRFKSVFFSLCFAGFLQEYNEKNERGFNVAQALKKSLLRLVHIHSTVPHMRTPEKLNAGLGKENWFTAGASYTAGDWYQYYKGNGTGLFSTISGLVGAVIFTAIDDGLFLIDCHNSIKETHTLLALTNALQEHMVAVASFFRKIQELQELIKKKGCDFSCIRMSCVGLASDRLKRLEHELSTSTFSHKSTSLYSRGRVLLAHKLMGECTQDIIPLLQLLGELDGYFSIARLYKEQESQKLRFCFAQVLKDSHAYMDVRDCWIPLLAEEQSVGNSFSWGTEHERANKIILTGPNGSGKSTVMKQVAWTVLLGQSWGIVPAGLAQFSLFGRIKTSLNPQESLQRGLSTFMAEKIRMDDITVFLHAWSKTSPVLLLLDEPYHGTVGVEAADRIGQFGMRIAECPWCMLLMATHMQEVTQLASQTNGVFANYTLDVLMTDAGMFTRTFTLKPGVAEWWFSNPGKRRQFIDQLLDKKIGLS
jgi:hypothetical protein